MVWWSSYDLSELAAYRGTVHCLFCLTYLLAGIWIVHRLIEAGIVVSGLSLTAAQWLGWRLWRKHGNY